MTESWFEINYRATSSKKEVAQNYFWESGAQGLVLDADETLIKAYFHTNNIKSIFENMKSLLNSDEISFKEVINEDWQEEFRKSCTTFKVDPDIYIVPSFEIDEFKKNNKNKLYIEMDPENAFGTGHHETTKLCLTALYEHSKKSSKALDIGTGSGILAILLKKLGLKDILATETDNDALITAKNNALKNGVEITFLHVDEDHIYEKKTFDLIVANILSGVLIHMAANIVNACKKDGLIILSGILVDQASEVIKAYEALNMKLFKQASMGEWCLLVFFKSSFFLPRN